MRRETGERKSWRRDRREKVRGETGKRARERERDERDRKQDREEREMAVGFAKSEEIKITQKE